MIPLLIPTLTAETDDLGLPDRSANLFGRIIRNPRPAGRPPKERACAEMLCSVLLNAPTLRTYLLAWMADLCGMPLGTWDDLAVRIDTEQPMSGKRDDLRIEGRDVASGRPMALLTIEVKVGSGFHESGSIPDDAEGGHVNQLLNYDSWLGQQPALTKAGLVLALSDMTDGLPDGLTETWRCTTWRQLASPAREAVEAVELPPRERFLAKHFIGFVDDHLRSGMEMDDDLIGFDDIALLRAVRHLGNSLNSKIERLVAPLADVIEQAGVGLGKASHQKKILQGHLRSVVSRALCDVANAPQIAAGVVTEDGVGLTLWLESAPRSRMKPVLGAVVRDRFDALVERDARWRVSADWTWWDLEIRRPLTELLGNDDQQRFIVDFVRSALQDLNETGLLDALNAAAASEV